MNNPILKIKIQTPDQRRYTCDKQVYQQKLNYVIKELQIKIPLHTYKNDKNLKHR
jgi:hypothetical protein